MARRTLSIGIAALATTIGSTLHAQARWAVEPSPFIDIHGATAASEPMFESAAAATRLADGRIVIGDGLGATVRFFDASGRPERTVGRRGNGPGEFQSLDWLGRCAGDTLFVYDRRQARMTLVAPDGRVASQHRVPSEDTPGQAPLLIACNGAGTFAMIPDRSGPVTKDGDADIMRRVGPVLLADRTARVTATLDTVTVGEFVVMGGGGAPRPLGRSTSLAMTRDRLYVGTADSAAVEVYDLSGRRMRPIAAGIANRRTAREQYEHAVDAVLAIAPPRARDRVRPMLLQVPMPETLPAYSAIRTDTDGGLWVVTSPPGAPAVELRALAPDGRVLGDVRIDAPLTVLEIGRDYILGAYEDAGGEPHVVAYRLRRG